MTVILFLAVLAILLVISRDQWWDGERNDLRMPQFINSLLKSIGFALPVFLVVLLVKNAVVVVPAGFRGVVFDKFKGLKPASLGEGLNFVTPFLQDVYYYDIRVQKVEFAAGAASKDLQSVSTKVAINFRPKMESVSALHRSVGVDYAEKVIHPAVQEAVKATTARYTAEELITKREDVKKHIQQLLQDQASVANIDVMETYITDFDFSTEFARAIEAKQIAEQDALKAKRDLDRIRIEAEQKIATAQAEARSLMLQREAITTNLIELRRVEAQRLAIEKWNGVLPQTILGGATPFIDISQVSSRRTP